MRAPVLRDHHPEQGVAAEVGHLAPIEGLRGVAVLGVIAFHYWVMRKGVTGDPWIALVNGSPAVELVVGNGFIGVDLFFLITGFLLTLPWFRHALAGRTAPSARDFYVRRVRRIVPAYYVHLAILFTVFLPLVHGAGDYLRNLYYLGFNIPAHFAFLHYLTPISSDSLGLNGALWTLALEAQYYLLLPLLAPLFGDFTWLVVPLCLGIAMYTLLTGAPRAAWVLLGNRPLRFIGRASYSAYLYHLPLLLAWNLHGPRDLGWMGGPAYLAATLAVAWLSSHLVERPFLSNRPARKEPWPTSAAPGASEAPSTSPTTTSNGDVPSTTTASSSSS